MSAMDLIIESDDVRFRQAVEDLGLLGAQQFQSQFNAACAALTGFEHTINNRACREPVAFLAPVYNISASTH